MSETRESTKPATEHTRTANAKARDGLPFTDRRDFDDAQRGFVATLDIPVIRRSDGLPVIDVTAHDFVLETDDAPDTVHPSLWRHAQVNHPHGLFEVTDGIYQVRGLDLSNVTIVEGDEGIIVIDPLVYFETAEAALALYRAHRGNRPVKALIYTHSHADHYGGAKAILSQDDLDSGRVVVIAPEGFLHEAVAENVYAGNAMSRRATYMYGPMIPPGPRGHINAGLANSLSNLGLSTLLAPTDLVSATGETRTVDGVDMVFQMAPGTEAPAEFLIHFPQRRALCAAEDATHTLHNLYTLRGAQVRDAATWWKTLNQTVQLFGADTDVIFAQHHWPRWGTDDIVTFLESQRDLYKYLHDQVLHLANKGETMLEIAEQLELPVGIAGEWHNRGYYGSVSHNAKAVYQRYLGWYDSNPANLHALPPTEAGVRYVGLLGGADAVLEKARAAFAEGEYRWAAEILSHLVFADPANRDAALLQADTFEQLGYQSENPTWRNEYLMGAQELRGGVRDLGAIELATRDVLAAMPPEMVFDFMGIKLDGPRAADTTSSIQWSITDAADDDAATYALELRNGCLVYTAGKILDQPSATVSSTRIALAGAVFDASETGVDAQDIVIVGDRATVTGLFSLLDDFPFWFPIVQP
ncbi:alkyl/aryl-sulfatase [Subtercola lobariae]|uniref:Linear primary-alkylsulfatase n=1 Tax=Subtercola lobariae TaxID=1588641 RepID=A0A917B5C5_9MICO|nr:alkyl sulfatase dimerization domain-containing protein [Subtercola lobariae]GGF23013.1 beta-lactamase-like protein [Subtercola lobariae]